MAAPPPPRPFEECVAVFTRQLSLMTNDLVSRYPEDPIISRAKKRINLGIDFDPCFVVDTVGGYLFRYREQVFAGDSQFFIENDFDEEIREGVDAEKVDLVSYIIPRVKEAWRRSDGPTREEYKDAVQGLLDVYLEYLDHRLPPP